MYKHWNFDKLDLQEDQHKLSNISKKGSLQNVKQSFNIWSSNKHFAMATEQTTKPSPYKNSTQFVLFHSFLYMKSKFLKGRKEPVLQKTSSLT